MAKTIILDSFPLSCMGKMHSDPATVTDNCRQWVIECIAAGNLVHVPAIVYYETLRELERLNATAQIKRLQTFCFIERGRFLPLETFHLEQAAQMWGKARRDGRPTADPLALDGDVILAAQAIALGLPPTQFVIATTNPGHLLRFAPAELWTEIEP